MAYGLSEAFERMSSLRTDTIRRTKRAFGSLGYYSSSLPEDEDIFDDEDIHVAVEDFQRDKGLRADGRIRVGGPTQHRVNAELYKRESRREERAQKKLNKLNAELSIARRKKLEAEDRNLGLSASVGRNGRNAPRDVRKTKRALSSISLYPKDKRRLESGETDRDLQFGLDILTQKYGIGMKDGRLERNSEAEHELRNLAAGNDKSYAASESREPERPASAGSAISRALLPKSPDKPRGVWDVFSSLVDHETQKEDKSDNSIEDFGKIPESKQVKIIEALRDGIRGARQAESSKLADVEASDEAANRAEEGFWQHVGHIAGAKLNHGAHPGQGNIADDEAEGTNMLERLLPKAHAADATSETQAEDENPIEYSDKQYRDMESKALAESVDNQVIIDSGYDPHGIHEKFIHSEEKGRVEFLATNGYVPDVNDGNNKPVLSQDSGVTIGHGVDLGQMNEYELGQIVPKDSELYKKLLPYLGLEGQEAKDKLDKDPLILTRAEAHAITRARYADIQERQIMHRLKNPGGNYALSGYTEKDYRNLDSVVRTVLFSRLMRVGPNAQKFVNRKDGEVKEVSNTRKIVEAAFANDIKAMADILYKEHGNKQESTRSKREADYLMKHYNKSSLSDQ